MAAHSGLKVVDLVLHLYFSGLGVDDRGCEPQDAGALLLVHHIHATHDLSVGVLFHRAVAFVQDQQVHLGHGQEPMVQDDPEDLWRHHQHLAPAQVNNSEIGSKDHYSLQSRHE